jgi:hypothetical protein
MLFHTELSVDAGNPDQVRSLLSRLSGQAHIGVVDALAIERNRIIRAHADRFNFTIFDIKGDISIYENLGPKAVRSWHIDPPKETEQVLKSIKDNFGEHEPGVEILNYLYTEASCFILRGATGNYLPRLKRRAFLTAQGQVVVLHSKQNDTVEGEWLEFVLEIEGRIWRCSYAVP